MPASRAWRALLSGRLPFDAMMVFFCKSPTRYGWVWIGVPEDHRKHTQGRGLDLRSSRCRFHKTREKDPAAEKLERMGGENRREGEITCASETARFFSIKSSTAEGRLQNPK